MARFASRGLLKFLKRNTMEFMIDLNQLSSPFVDALQSVLRRDFTQSVVNLCVREVSCKEIIDTICETAMKQKGKLHNEAMSREAKRKQDVIVAAKMAEIQKQNETIERKKRRNEMREEVRI